MVKSRTVIEMLGVAIASLVVLVLHLLVSLYQLGKS
jgi:hypothetical protein